MIRWETTLRPDGSCELLLEDKDACVAYTLQFPAVRMMYEFLGDIFNNLIELQKIMANRVAEVPEPFKLLYPERF